MYKNEGVSFPLIGELNVESHGYSSNGLCKINDKLICSGANNYFFIICIAPLQVIQKFPFNNITVYYIYVTKEDYLLYIIFMLLKKIIYIVEERIVLLNIK